MHLQKKSLFDLDPKVKVTRNVAQYPLHHVTYSATKFEVATSNGLEGDTFTREGQGQGQIIHSLVPWGQGHRKCCPVPSTSCDLFSLKLLRLKV